MTVEVAEPMKVNVDSLNNDIMQFPQVFPITAEMNVTHKGVSRLVMLDRYSFKDTEKKTLKVGDIVVLTVKEDPNFPARGIGIIKEIDHFNHMAKVQIEEEYKAVLEDEALQTGMIWKSINSIDKPLELFYEQIAKRNAFGLAKVERTPEKRQQMFEQFYKELVALNFVPAGRVLYGAGAEKDVTFFNCYVMPFVKDSREGISDYRKEVMEIMSRGGGVGTNGSTLRPRNALARGVNGKSSGAVSWLDDIAKLTHLVEQGGSRRGAQMIMLNVWHPDVIEFIISKMQNPKILRFIIDTIKDEKIQELAKQKLKFTALSANEREMYQTIATSNASESVVSMANEQLADGGNYTVHNPEFLTGANISVCLTKEFMEAVEKDKSFTLEYPDVDHYSPQEMKEYNEKWAEIGDVREWRKLGYAIKEYRKIQAKDLWNLINICATYSAEPGIFFIDNANEMTNAHAYGQKVVATNPCGEQPLAPYSVCNLAAVNLAEMADKQSKTINFTKLKETVKTGVRMQDNVIDATPYFLAANKKQALGERRIGLGVMGLHDLLIYCEAVYGSEAGNNLIEQIFETMAITAYETSIELAKEKGSFPFLVGKNEAETKELRQKFIDTGFMKKMPDHIRQGVLDFGIRNSHLLTVAPTGSTGTMVGVSTGLEPYFAFKYYRSGRLGKFIEVNAPIVEEYLKNNPNVTADNLPEWFVSAMELSPEAHANTQCIIQRWIDSSISKTVNAPKGYAVNQVQAVYELLYNGGAKGGTVYVDGSRDAQVLTLTAEENHLETEHHKEENPSKVALIETIAPLEDTNITIGSEVGNTCPVCRKGNVKEVGGCNTCTNCNAQLKCGL